MNKEKISQAQLRRRAQLKKNEPSVYARLLKKEKKMTTPKQEESQYIDEEGPGYRDFPDDNWFHYPRVTCHCNLKSCPECSQVDGDNGPNY